MEPMRYELTPREEIYARVSRLQLALRQADINGALITENTDLFYFSGMIQRSFLFIPAYGEPVLAVTGNLERAREESPLKYIMPLDNVRNLDKLLTDFDLSVAGRTGMDYEVLPASYYLYLQQIFKNADFVDISEIVRRLRMVKSPWEVERVRLACKMQNEVMDETIRFVKVGMTELDIDAHLTAYIRRKGHQGQFRTRGYNQAIHYAHILFGKASAMATYVKGPLGGMGTTPAYPIGSGFNVITQDQPLVIDFGVGIGGYISDMTRTFVIGRLPAGMVKAHQLAREIKRFVIEWVKPGKSPAELYGLILEKVSKAGLENNFMGFGNNRMPFVGHGIGLELDEYPVIASNFNLPFEAGMVFSLEPKFVFPEKGAVGIEDDFAVTADGLELLTTYNDDILVIPNSSSRSC